MMMKDNRIRVRPCWIGLGFLVVVGLVVASVVVVLKELYWKQIENDEEKTTQCTDGPIL